MIARVAKGSGNWNSGHFFGLKPCPGLEAAWLWSRRAASISQSCALISRAIVVGTELVNAGAPNDIQGMYRLLRFGSQQLEHRQRHCRPPAPAPRSQHIVHTAKSWRRHGSGEAPAPRMLKTSQVQPKHGEAMCSPPKTPRQQAEHGEEA